MSPYGHNTKLDNHIVHLTLAIIEITTAYPMCGREISTGENLEVVWAEFSALS